MKVNSLLLRNSFSVRVYFVAYYSDSWDGEVCIQRSGVEPGDVSNRCSKHEHLVGCQDGEQLVWVHIHASTYYSTAC